MNDGALVIVTFRRYYSYLKGGYQLHTGIGFFNRGNIYASISTGGMTCVTPEECDEVIRLTDKLLDIETRKVIVKDEVMYIDSYPITEKDNDERETKIQGSV
jgi:hypothetical protein